MNLQFKFGYCMTNKTLNIALDMLVGRNYVQMDYLITRYKFFLIINLYLDLSTVKPVYNGHSMEKQNMAVVGR